MNISTYTIGSRLFGFSRVYEVKDSSQQIIYMAQKKLFKRLYILRDQAANDMFEIRKKNKMFQYVFEVVSTEESVEVQKHAFKKDLRIFTVAGEWILKGNWKGKAYELFDPHGEAIAKVSRKPFRSKDQYGLAIKDGYNDLLIISVIIAMDWMIRIKKAAAAAG